MGDGEGHNTRVSHHERDTETQDTSRHASTPKRGRDYQLTASNSSSRIAGNRDAGDGGVT